MNKITVPSLMLMLMGFFASNVHAELVWTKYEGVPSDWSPLENNLLAGELGTVTGSTSWLTPKETNIAKLTDGDVPTSRSYHDMLGFAGDSTVEWNFAGPMTLEKIRITTCDITDGRQYDDIVIADVEVKVDGADEWVSLGCGSVEWNGSNKEGIMCYVKLENSEAGHLVESVVGLRIKFGPHKTVAQYYSEIEASGFAEMTRPILGSVVVAPAKTKAIVSGSIADVGGDATSCDVYLALDEAVPVKILRRMTGAFEYQIEGLTPGTTYSYTLSVSNNATVAKGSSHSGTFKMLAADALTTTWTTSDVVPDGWLPLSDGNLLSGIKGELAGNITTDYSTADAALLTDGFVPTTGGKQYRVGFQAGASITWMFDKPMSFGQLRVSACYLDDYNFTRLAIGAVSVKVAGSDIWENFDAEVLSDIGGRYGKKVVLCATLSDIEKGYLAKNVVALKIDFGNVGALASYVVEVEAAGIKKPQKKPGLSVIVR